MRTTDFYLCGMAMDDVHRNNPCSEDDLKERIQNAASSFSSTEIRRTNNEFVMYGACLQPKGNQFQHHL
jgi:hypothetical protein